MKVLRSHKELDVYQLAFTTSMEIFVITKTLPKDEVFSLSSQIRRSSRSVSANIAEAFRKRRYEKAFVLKLSDSEAEAAETQVWIDYLLSCEYIKEDVHDRLFIAYENILGKLVNMMLHPENGASDLPIHLLTSSPPHIFTPSHLLDTDLHHHLINIHLPGVVA